MELTIGEIIQTTRKRIKMANGRSMSREFLAHKINCTTQNIYRIEKGIGTPSYAMLSKLAQALNCELIIEFKPIKANENNS